MRIFNKNITSIFLMSVSLILLIGFNVFWIFKNYQEQKTLLQKEVDNAFGKTIGMMQDSLIQNQLEVSNNFEKKPTNIRFVKKKAKVLPSEIEEIPNTIHRTLGLMKDSIHHNIFDTVQASKVSIFINSTGNISPDSLKKILGKISSGVRKKNESAMITLTLRSDSVHSVFLKKDSLKSQNPRISLISTDFKPKKDLISSENVKIKEKISEKDFVFVLKNDSLKIPEIQSKYQSELAKNQIKLPFQVIKFSKETFPKINSEIITEKFSADYPVKKYYAVFSDYKPFLFRKIIPEILFSLFLIGITALTFGLIYRNLQKQKRLTELKNDFISNVTHELKTPISTVSVAIEALSNFNVLQNPNQTKEYLNISRNELNRLSMLVDKVLKMSIFEQKELDLKTEEIDFKNLIENVLSSMKLQFEKHQSQVNLDFVGDDFRLKGDSIHLTNVVYNLLDNALKYSSEPQINVLLNEKESEIELSVKDNGQGIPKEFQEKIFEKFFRVPTGNIHTIKGYGLGLSYVWSVVEKHKGKILVKSIENEGSDFTISLPKIAQ